MRGNLIRLAVVNQLVRAFPGVGVFSEKAINGVAPYFCVSLVTKKSYATGCYALSGRLLIRYTADGNASVDTIDAIENALDDQFQQKLNVDEWCLAIQEIDSERLADGLSYGLTFEKSWIMQDDNTGERGTELFLR